MSTPNTRSARFAEWPSSRNFIAFDSSVDRTQRLHFILAANASMEPSAAAELTADRLVELRLICDPAHPAVGGCGLFAKTKISKGTIITAYAGYIQQLSSPPLPGTETYGMSYYSHPNLVIDAEYVGNYGRFANDPRSTFRTANLVAQNKLTWLGENATVLVTRTQVQAGDELLLDYGKNHACVERLWHDRHGNALARERLPTMPFPLRTLAPLWHCCQCGAFNQASDMLPTVHVCHNCGEPRAIHSYVVAVRRSQLDAVGQQEVKWAEGKVGSKRKRVTKVREDSSGATSPVSVACSVSSTATSTVSTPPVTKATPLDRTNTDESNGDEASAGQPVVSSTVAPSSMPMGWPMNLPFISWQLWDPEVPMGELQRCSVFEKQEKIGMHEIRSPGDGDSGREPRMVVFPLKRVAAGDQVGVAGGLIVFDDDERLLDRSVTSVALCGLGLTSGGELVDPRMRMIITNEMRHIVFIRGGSAPDGNDRDGVEVTANVRLRLSRDPLGCVYVSVVAITDVNAWDTLVAEAA